MDVSLSVNQVLQTGGFCKSKIIAGEKGLGRKVSKITIAELPDTLNWLQGGELVCSTVYYLKDNPEVQLEWISGMYKRDVAALAIKPARFIGDVPQHMIKLADELGFPLIELPLEITWPAIINGVMSKMLEIQTKRLKQSQQIHDKLTTLVLESKGLPAIAKTLAELVKNPVILEDRFFNLIEYAYPSGENEHEAIKIRTSKEMIETMRMHPCYLQIQTNKEHKIINANPIIIDNKIYDHLIHPIIAGNDFLGWLTVLLLKKNEESFYRIALEHGATVIALELLKEKASLETLYREKADFLRVILEDAYVSESDLRKRANLLGINMNLPTMVMIIEMKNDVIYPIYQKIEEYILHKDPYDTLIKRAQDIVIFSHPLKPGSIPELVEFKKLGQNISCLLDQLGRLHNIGIGSCYSGVRMIKRSYFEAQRAVLAAAKGNNRVVAYAGLGFDRLISLFPDSSELKTFCQDYLGVLLEYDQKHNSKLLYTLKCYLNHNGNHTETARYLHLHLNSLNYRLQRIQEIIDVDLEDAETRMLLFFTISIIQEEKSSLSTEA